MALLLAAAMAACGGGGGDGADLSGDVADVPGEVSDVPGDADAAPPDSPDEGPGPVDAADAGDPAPADPGPGDADAADATVVPFDPARLRLMTFNLRHGFAEDGPDNTWAKRLPRALATIGAQAPDVFGIQEGWLFQVEDLQAGLPGYQWAGISRLGNDFNEYSAVFWRADRFDLAEDGTFWLSDTPEVPGSQFAATQLFPRIVTWVRLGPRDGGEPFVFLNTHFDTTDADEVKERSAALLARKVDEIAGTAQAFVVGDFNSSGRTSRPWRILTGAETYGGTRGRLADSWDDLGLPESGTTHAYDGVPEGARIDWILHLPGPRAVAAQVLSAPVEGGWPSDHFPVAATIARDVTAVPLFDRVRISSWGEDEHFQRADTTVDAGAGPFAAVRLVADLETSCFPFESWAGNPPPQDQNWPADCDAFDRNYEFTLDEPVQEGDAPAIELVRAITPFGGPMHLDVDVTDVFNARPGPHRLRVVIPTWSDGAGQVSGSHGGWWVTARLETVPGTPPRRALAAIPLFNGVVGAGPLPAAVPFALPDGTTAARIEYRATGHGGADPGSDFRCVGPAEEFCWRDHAMVIDGATAATWNDVRTPSCSALCTIAHYGPAGGGFDYCGQNPCGAIGSVVAGRANWCPGSVTPPKVLDLADLKAGPRTFAFDIPGILEGGIWRISAVLVATGD